MNVGQLIVLLSEYPEDMDVVTPVYSDYTALTEEIVHPIMGVNKGFYVMRSHPTMNDDNKEAEQEFLLLGYGY